MESFEEWDRVVDFWRMLFFQIRRGHIRCLRVCSVCDRLICHDHMTIIDGERVCDVCSWLTFGDRFMRQFEKWTAEIGRILSDTLTDMITGVVNGFAKMGTTAAEAAESFRKFASAIPDEIPEDKLKFPPWTIRKDVLSSPSFSSLIKGREEIFCFGKRKKK